MIRNVFDDSPLSIERVDNIKRSSDLYHGFIYDLRQQHKDDWDVIIIITGLEGSGKSSLAVNLACDLDNDVIDNFEDHVVWSGDKLNKLIFSKDPSAFVHDEGGLDFFSRDAMGKETKELIKMVMTMRAQNHIPILVLPNLNWLDSYLREHRIGIWVKVWTVKNGLRKERGFATVYTASRGDFQKKTFWNNQFTFRFPDFPPEVERKYKHLKKANMLERMVGSPIDDRSTYIVRAANPKYGLKQSDIAEIFGLSQPRISQTLKEAKDILEKAGAKQNDM